MIGKKVNRDDSSDLSDLGKENKDPNIVETKVDLRNKLNLDYLSSKVTKKGSYDGQGSVLYEIRISKELILRRIRDSYGEWIDLRKFWKDYPTKKGIRLNYKIFMDLFDHIKKLEEQHG
jgi:hypothetical protein